MSGKHAGPAEEDPPRSDMDGMTPQEKADTFDRLYESNAGSRISRFDEAVEQKRKRSEESA